MRGGFGGEFRAETGGQANDQDTDDYDRDRRDARALALLTAGEALQPGLPELGATWRGGQASGRGHPDSPRPRGERAEWAKEAGGTRGWGLKG